MGTQRSINAATFLIALSFEAILDDLKKINVSAEPGTRQFNVALKWKCVGERPFRASTMCDGLP
jgi:hypothetical protein